MEMHKAQWLVDGQNVRLVMPFSKVDQANRIVSGWATLDNNDEQGDIVLAAASVDAFSQARGNIREMHQPIAAGRMVNFKEDSYFNPQDGQTYRGIWVDVYVSKGAPDTWEKVLDGTLSGFSIGGSIKDYEPAMVNGQSCRVIKAYDLVELSLVDNPANQLANIFSITKSADGVIVKGMLADTKLESIYWCVTDELCITSDSDEKECPSCHEQMDNIGWVEEADPDKVEKIREAVAEVTGPDDGSSSSIEELDDTTEQIIKTSTNDALEGGNMAEENSDVLEKTVAVDEAVAAVEETDAVVDEAANADTAAAEVSEVEAEEPDFAKMLGDLQSAIEAGLVKNQEETNAALSDAVAKFDTKVDELQKSHTVLSEKVAAMAAKAEEVEKALTVVDAATALKKSGDLGGSSEESLEKSRNPLWGGHFLSASDLNN